MWFWPHRISTPPFFNKIFLSSYYIPTFWPRNCSSTPTSMSHPNWSSKDYTYYSPSAYCTINYQPNLRMNSKRIRMIRIMVVSLSKTSDFDSLDHDNIHNYQMSITYINILLAFTVSLIGLLMYRSHIMSSLLCLEGIMLSLFVLISIIILTTHITLASIVPIILLVFAACEAALGLSLLVMVSNTYGVDYVQNLNLLQC